MARPKKESAPPEKPRQSVQYGKQWPAQFTPADVEAWCFLKKLQADKLGLGPFRHLKNMTRHLWPKLEWNAWSETQEGGLCENSFISWTGCATAGKTFTAAHFGISWWAVDPGNTTVILTSTTSKMVRRRIWPVLQELYHSCQKIEGSALFCKGIPGILVDSKTTLHAMKVSETGKIFKDDKHGIFAMAVREGSTSKAVADIQGVHSPRMMIVVDEATDTPEAIFEAITNLRKGCDEFILLTIGNPVSHLDPHGVCCTPKNGWKSINIDDEEWPTLGVDKWDIDPGMCYHFDGTKSPNITAGFRKYSYLISEEDVQRSARQGEENIGHWKFTRGFWPPEGFCKTIFSEALVEKHDGMGKHIFIKDVKLIGSLDTAFGGDGCVLRFAKLGEIDGAKMGITITDCIEIIPKAKSEHEMDYQIASEALAECKKRGVEPQNFGLDASGTGRGVAAILAQEWSDQIIKVEFGGAASDKPASMDDNRPAYEVYDRRVTELWYSAREFLQAGQLKGLTADDVIEFCSRQYDMPGRKFVLDTKEDCKKKIGRSPDNADSAVILIEVARQLGAAPWFKGEARRSNILLEIAKKAHEVYDEGQHEQIESRSVEEIEMSLF